MPLSPTLLETLREYCRWMRPKTYLFPGTVDGWRADKPITPKVLWDACRRPRRAPGIEKRVTRTCCGIVTRHICLKPARTCARFRSCSATQPRAHVDLSAFVAAPPAGGHQSAGHVPVSRRTRCGARDDCTSGDPATLRGGRYHSPTRDTLHRDAPRLADARSTCASSAPSRSAAPPRSAGISIAVPPAAIAPSRTTRAAIGIAQSARPTRATSGSPSVNASCCRSGTCMSSSRFPTHSPGWRCRTSGWSTTSCSGECRDAARGGAHPKHLGAEIGFLSVLHTWGRSSCTIPTSTASCPPAASRPTHALGPSAPVVFLPVKVLSRVFRGKFIAGLRDAFHAGDPQAPSDLQRLTDERAFRAGCAPLFRHDWVVYAKPPFGGPGHVLHYLARYTHRVAISNHRLVDVTDDQVTFRWKDYRHGSQVRLMTLSAEEFLRRFCLHVLPKGFVRIRFYGFWPLAVAPRRCHAAGTRSI